MHIAKNILALSFYIMQIIIVLMEANTVPQQDSSDRGTTNIPYYSRIERQTERQRVEL